MRRLELPRQRRWLVLFLALNMGNCFAAEPDGLTEQDYLQEFPVVLSASRLSQPLSEAPNAMTVIDRKMIVASGFRNLPDIFKLVPGMYVSYYAGSQAIVSYHGSLSQDAPGMQVLVDGRSVYLPPFNVVDWALLPITLDDIERIEVIRGPAAASYGENSVHGVINIITRDAGAITGSHVAITRGNKGVNDVTMQFGGHEEKLDHRMTLAYRADNGYDNLAVPPNGMSLAMANGDVNNSNDSNQARLMNYRATWHLNAADDLDVQIGFNHDVQGVGFWDSTLDKMHDMVSYSNSQQIEWQHKPDRTSELHVRYSHIQYSTNQVFQLGTPAYTVSTSMKTGRNEIELQHILQTSETNRLVYGGGYRRDQVDGNSWYPAPGVTQPQFSTAFGFSEYRIFANDEWRVTPKLLINVGGMLEKNAMDQGNSSPRASLNYHFTPQHTVRVGASVAYRTPSLGERNANGANQYQLGIRYEPGPNVTSPGLTSEKVVSREVGYLGEFHDMGASLDLRVYNDQYGNLFYPGPGIWKNGMTANYTGVEATVKKSWGRFGDLTLNCSTAMANSNYSSLTPGQPDWLAKSLPRNSGSLLYSVGLPGNVALSAAYYLQTASVGFDRGPVDYQPTQHRTDLRIAKSFKSGGGMEGEVAGVVQNLFGTDYTDYVSTALFNRRAYVTLSFHWQ